MLNQKRVSIMIGTLEKFIQNIAEKNEKIVGNNRKEYEFLTAELEKETTIIIPLYEPRYLFEIKNTYFVVRDLVEEDKSITISLKDISFYENKDGDISMIVSVYHNFYISRKDKNLLVSLKRMQGNIIDKKYEIIDNDKGGFIIIDSSGEVLKKFNKYHDALDYASGYLEHKDIIDGNVDLDRYKAD
ncbi:MAG: hypothetical protein ACERKK_12660 [Poseidonibacter sp.]|uniref:hypothetical protein n=1 Tax=Poseidonibacter sp. TaxID=2321188 RepID=UPI00359D3209